MHVFLVFNGDCLYYVLYISSSPGHYVTPFDTGSSQVITQPMSTTQQVAAVGSIPSTSGYEISQAQSLYTQQIAANHRAQQVNKLSTASPTTRACPEIVSGDKFNGTLLFQGVQFLNS